MMGLLILAAAYVVPNGQAFSCLATGAYDADGPIYCTQADGRKLKLRLQGVGAVEADGTCRQNQPCGIMDPKRAKRLTEQLVTGKRLRCVSHGGALRDRTAASCTLPSGRLLSCEVIRSGAGTRWAKYDPNGELRRCGHGR